MKSVGVEPTPRKTQASERDDDQDAECRADCQHTALTIRRCAVLCNRFNASLVVTRIVGSWRRRTMRSAIHAWNARSEPDLHQKHSRLIAPSELTDLPLLYTAGIQNGEQKLAHECGRFSTQPTLEKGSH